jgi:hypothetical protein
MKGLSVFWKGGVGVLCCKVGRAVAGLEGWRVLRLRGSQKREPLRSG